MDACTKEQWERNSVCSKNIVFTNVVVEETFSLIESKQALSIQPQTTITTKISQPTIKPPSSKNQPPLPPHLIHRPHHLNPPLPPTPHSPPRRPPTEARKLTLSARDIDALGRLLDGVAGAFVVDDGFAFEDGGGGGAVVAAVAVGDLLAHVVVCGWSLRVEIWLGFWIWVRVRMGGWIDGRGLGGLFSGGEGDIYGGSFREIR